MSANICVSLLDGRTENVDFEKISTRLRTLCYDLNMDYVDPVKENHFLLFPRTYINF